MKTLKIETGKAYSLFGKSGMMEEIKPIPNLPIGCKVFAYGYGMEATEGAIISQVDEFGNYKGVYISDYKSGFFTLDEYCRAHSTKFGIGHYFDDNLETFDEAIIEEYILKAEIAEKLRNQAKAEKLKADNEEILNLPILYPHLLVNTKDEQNITKKNIVAELKKNFPFFKFSVKKDYHSSYSISWVDGPTYDEVDSVVKKFEDHQTDITGDFRDPNPSNFNKVFGGFTYVSTSRKMSDEFSALLQPLKKLENDNSLSVYSETSDLLYRIFRKTSLPFGAIITGIEPKKDFSGSTEDFYTVLFSSPLAKEKAIQEPQSCAAKNLKLELVQYSDKALAVFGDTIAVKDSLKALGGRFNPALTHNGEKKCGWIFSNAKRMELEQLFNF